jgi:hypothetical protein
LRRTCEHECLAYNCLHADARIVLLASTQQLSNVPALLLHLQQQQQTVIEHRQEICPLACVTRVLHNSSNVPALLLLLQHQQQPLRKLS